MKMTDGELEGEFERQVESLVSKGYPELAGMGEKRFRALVNMLEDKVDGRELPELDLERGWAPLAIVVKNKLVETKMAVEVMVRGGKAGLVKLDPLEMNDFETIETVEVPEGEVYLILDIGRGKENLNLPPKEAMIRIRQKRRSPLTIDEGVAVVTQFPDFLRTNNCFSLLASRHRGDKRVPAFWISEGRARLGWCWDGNPHTWMGSASVKTRIGL